MAAPENYTGEGLVARAHGVDDARHTREAAKRDRAMLFSARHAPTLTRRILQEPPAAHRHAPGRFWVRDVAVWLPGRRGGGTDRRKLAHAVCQELQAQPEVDRANVVVEDAFEQLCCQPMGFLGPLIQLLCGLPCFLCTLNMYIVTATFEVCPIGSAKAGPAFGTTLRVADPYALNTHPRMIDVPY